MYLEYIFMMRVAGAWVLTIPLSSPQVRIGEGAAFGTGNGGGEVTRTGLGSQGESQASSLRRTRN